MLSVWHHNNNTKEQVRSSACSLLPQNIYLPDPHFLTHTLYRSKQHATALQQGALLAVLLASHNTPSIAKMQSPRLVTKAPLSHVSLHYPRPRRATRVLRLARASNAGDSNLTSFEGVASPPSPELVAAVEAPNGPGMISNDPTQHGSNPFAAISASYAASLSANPVGTKAFTSLVGFMVGDMCAQLLTPGAFEVARVLRLGAYGFFLDGPIGHLFYKTLDERVSPDNPTHPSTILAKTAIDQLVWAPSMTVVFFVFLRLLEGQPDAIMATVHDRVLPTLLANYAIWPFAHYISFRWIPTDYRILYNNVISIAWITWLSMFAAGSISIDLHALTIQAQHWVNTMLTTADTPSMVTNAMDGLQRGMGLTPYYSSTPGLEVTYESLVKLSQARFVSNPPAPWQ